MTQTGENDNLAQIELTKLLEPGNRNHDPPRILIIHPEGNINNNPNLSGIVEILCEHGYDIDILSPKLLIPQITPCDGSKLLLYNPLVKRITSKIKKLYVFNFLFDYQIKIFGGKGKYHLIIAIDRNGIIEASYYSHFLGIPYGLISYEISFKDETSVDFKNIEIEACKDIEFAVCQDHIRSSHLARENQIALNKIINMPVAGRGIKKRERTQYLHSQLNIPPGKKIAIYAGAIAKWSMIEELIQTVNDWPKEWVLVLHNRYGLNSRVLKLIGDINTDLIYISHDSYPKPEDLSKMLYSVDLGIALYNPLDTGIYDGNNLKYLGLSSGKIATYLQHGIPVLTNENGLISDYIREYKAGYIVREINKIPEFLKKIDITECRKNSYILFNEQINLDKFIDPLLKTIEEISKAKNISENP